MDVLSLVLLGMFIAGAIMVFVGIIYCGMLYMEPAPPRVTGHNFWVSLVPIGLGTMLFSGLALLYRWYVLVSAMLEYSLG